MDIMKSDKVNKFFEKFEVVFKYLFLTLTLLSFNNIFAGHVGLKIYSAVIVVMGAVIILYRLFNFKKYVGFYGFPLLIALAVAYGISSILTIKFGMMENVQAIAWMVLHYGILYATDRTAPKETGKNTYFNLLKYFLVWIAVSNIASIVMLVVGYGRNANGSFNGNLTGFLWGRLWGVYSDPNQGAVLCIAAIVISIYFFAVNKKIWNRILMAVNIFLSLSYMAFSDSRTGVVCIFVVLLVYMYVILNGRNIVKSNKVKKQIVCILIAIVIAFVGAGSLSLIKNGYNKATLMIYNMQDSDTDSPATENKQDEEINIIDRTGDELENDISNRRFDLWKSGIEVWQNAPLFGISHRNIVPFALENTPETYLVNNDMVGNFNTTHNTYIDILLSQGIVGALIFITFIVCVVWLVFKKMFILPGEKYCTPENNLRFGLVLSFACAAFFVLEIMYINTPGAFLFWISLSGLVKNLKE